MLCLQQVRDYVFFFVCLFVVFFINLRILSSFSNASSVGRWLDILKYWWSRPGVLLLLHIVGQGPAVLAAGAGRVAIFFIFFI